MFLLAALRYFKGMTVLERFPVSTLAQCFQTDEQSKRDRLCNAEDQCHQLCPLYTSAVTKEISDKNVRYFLPKINLRNRNEVFLVCKHDNN